MAKLTKGISIVFLLTLISQNIFAGTNYVSKTGGHVSPFTSWANAATNIQAAVDAASAGDTVLVNDGTYYPNSQISVTIDITVKSINGAEKTIVNGNQSHRCFYINSGDIIEGFTITDGKAGYAGGVWCDNGGTIQNCIIVGNSSSIEGAGGVYCESGGIVLNCTISGNSSVDHGGGVCCAHGGTVRNCTIIGNSANYGGGVSCHSGGMVQNCTISGNSISSEGAAGVHFLYSGGIIQNSILWNDNGLEISGTPSANTYNCIENWTNIVDGIITNNPQFVDIASGNYHLKTNSPCINSGTNMAWMVGAKDLDGNPRIQPSGGIVDMGCYEFVPEPGAVVLILSAVFWLMRKTK